MIYLFKVVKTKISNLLIKKIIIPKTGAIKLILSPAAKTVGEMSPAS